MPDLDNNPSRDRDPNNIVFWRLAALEEAVKYQTAELNALREKEDAGRRELERSYVRRDELRVASVDRRDNWTLRFVAAGILASNLIAILALILPHR